MSLTKNDQRLRRSRQTRLRIAQQRKARLTVFRSNLHIYASVISDDGSKVLASASTAEKDVRVEFPSGKGGNTAAAAAHHLCRGSSTRDRHSQPACHRQSAWRTRRGLCQPSTG
mgnify:CR=1 FL=1